MSDSTKTREQLIAELTELRDRIATMETTGGDSRPTGREAAYKRAEKHTTASPERLRMLFEFAPDACYLSDLKGVFVDGNRAAEEMTGFERSDLVGKNFLKLNLLPPSQIPRATKLLVKNTLGRPTGPDEFTLTKKDGGQVMVEITTFPIAVEGQKLVLGIARDISEHKQALREMERSHDELETRVKARTAELTTANEELQVEINEHKNTMEALRESEEKFSKAFHSGPGLMSITTRAEGNFIDVNQAFADAVERTRAELIGHSSIDLDLWLRPADRVAVIRQIDESGGVRNVEIALRMRSGETRTTLMNLEPMTLAGQPCLLSTGIDITGRKRLEEQLRQSQLLASLGEMMAGIAHEVNNPLAAILLYSELAGKAGVLTEAKKDIRIIRSEAKRASNIMKDLLAYSRKQEPITRRIDLHRIIRKVIEMRRYQQQVRNITLTIETVDGPLRMPGNAAQLTQLFMNLIVNAEEAVEKSTDRKIAIATEKIGVWARITVADSGTGIAEKHLPQVFFPFFTTKQTGAGTGLGLSTCHGIVTAHGGLIHAENNEMGGASFIVDLPLAKSAR